MQTSGLVITLPDDPTRATETLAEVEASGAFTIGPTDGVRRAVVLEADCPDATNRWHDWLRTLPGVESVDVVFIHWDESEPKVVHDGE